jgi:hypothetical protein
VVEIQCIVDSTEVADDPKIYTALVVFPMHSIRCEVYLWNYHNLKNYLRVPKY